MVTKSMQSNNSPILEEAGSFANEKSDRFKDLSRFSSEKVVEVFACTDSCLTSPWRFSVS